MESKLTKQKRLASVKAEKAFKDAAQEAKDNQTKVLAIWQELNYDKQSELIQVTAERNEAYRSFRSTKQDLLPLVDHTKNAWVYSIIAVTFASVLDAFLWRDMFETIDGLPSAISRAAGLSLAVFVAIMSVFAGRALKEKSSLNNPDEFNSTQLAVFNKRTKHNKFIYASVPLILVAVVIPVLRYDDTKSILATGIFTGISYFIALAVVSVEYHMHDIWQAEIKQSQDLFDQAKNIHQIALKSVFKIGQNLIYIDPKQDVTFNKFMNNSKFKLIEDLNNETYIYTPNHQLKNNEYEA